MKAVMFSARSFDREWFNKIIKQTNDNLEITYLETRLCENTVLLAKGFSVVICFVNDDLDKKILTELHKNGTTMVALRCAGFNKVCLDTAKSLNFTVSRVPSYSPEAVAEHAVALLQTLNRKIHKAYNRTREANFSLDGLCGFTLYGKTVGIIGTGRIGRCAINIFLGYGAKIIAYDVFQSDEVKAQGVQYVELQELVSRSDVISIHCPMTPENYHLMGVEAFEWMKPGCILVNTSRGGLVDCRAALNALEKRVLGGLASDVYEEESELFFDDHSNEIIGDDLFRQLSSCYNVIFTGHQAFLTHEALEEIATVTLNNIQSFKDGKRSGNEVFFSEIPVVSIGDPNKQTTWETIKKEVGPSPNAVKKLPE
eukprot:GHVL01012759.1.p1 GENE.GHVL01012759.1~~GHVL01012759.1.p1  ORF type:complete len:369 (-),score=53.31 GHVL01012759.1:96-1202(-)